MLNRAQVFSQSWPIILANAAIGLAAIVDTFVIGRFEPVALAGMSAGAAIYAIIYWGFGFLRMTTAGLSAQAEGAKDEAAVQSHLYRAVPLGIILGLTIFLLQFLLIPAGYYFYQGTPETESAGAIYIQARLWGLPAYLGLIAIMGWFIGLGRAGNALVMQIIFNGLNIVLSFLFVAEFGWGLTGVGIATAVAEWIGLFTGLVLAVRIIKKRGGIRKQLLRRGNILNVAALTTLGEANTNIFIRTAALTLGFTFFSSAAAAQGDLFLSGFHIHLQLITLSAFILDGFANTAEARVGAAFGARSRPEFDRAVRLTTEFAYLFGLICSLAIYFLGPWAIDLLTTETDIRDMAKKYLPFCAMVPLLGAGAYQMDGIFIGITKTKEMRNAGLAALAIYLAIHFTLPESLGPTRIWYAFWAYYLARAATLYFYYPKVRPA
ncbi:MAG: MATE family efflux transporter [Hellea sp.]|nr:MATE family efflux transporter [Hellea sp.]